MIQMMLMQTDETHKQIQNLTVPPNPCGVRLFHVHVDCCVTAEEIKTNKTKGTCSKNTHNVG